MAVDDSGGHGEGPVRLPVVGQAKAGAVDESSYTYDHPIYQTIESTPGLSLATASVDQLLVWGLKSSIWVFPMATSCCGIELMAAAASRVDLDRMGTIVRATPRQADVMVVAGTITVKMAPRVKKLWEQMPEPKWCIAMGSCAISGDFYRDLYSVIPGIDTVIPVDVYIPGCPPNPEALMHGLLRLKDKVAAQREGKFVRPAPDPARLLTTRPSVPRVIDAERRPETSVEQGEIAMAVTARDVLIVREREQQARAALAEAEAQGFDDYGDPDEDGSATPASAPAPDQGEDFVNLLKTRFGLSTLPADGPPIVPRERHRELAKALVDRGYKQLVYIVGSHWPEGRGRAGAVAGEPEHFEVAYGLRTLGAGSRLASWSLRLLPGEAAPSLVGLLVAADWQEREQYDLFGIPFEGHPDLRRLLLPEGWDGYPLRRDYPADAHVAPWR